MCPKTALSRRVSPRKASILAYCRIFGWVIAGAFLTFATVEIDAQLRMQHARAEASKREALSKVRACVHDVRRRQSWESCETTVQAEE